MMENKKLVFIVLTSIFAFGLKAQNIEWDLRFNVGKFSFTGESAGGITKVWVNPLNRVQTESPYGTKHGLSYGFSARIVRFTKLNILVGADFGYEVMKAYINLGGITIQSRHTGTSSFPASGQSKLSYNCYNFYPHIGYRLKLYETNIDLNAGLDVVYLLNVTEKGEVTYIENRGTRFARKVGRKIYNDRKSISTELRWRTQIDVFYKKIGVFVSYSKGLTNFVTENNDRELNEVYGNLYRFGLIYKL